MLYESDNIQIKYTQENGFRSLHFTFIGKFTKKSSEASCKVWKELFENDTSDQMYQLTWDCIEMAGFENDAKNEWMNTMNLLENRIELITVISDNIIVRGVCQLMSRIYSFEIKILKSYEQQ